MNLEFRIATSQDAATLARLNAELIKDEGHRISMSVSQLERRMADWLGGGYEVVFIEYSGETVGYVLYRRETEHVVLRQMFIVAAMRRRGIGRSTIDWLRVNACTGVPRLRIEVLTSNPGGIEFWRSVGFQDYAMTMELEVQSDE